MLSGNKRFEIYGSNTECVCSLYIYMYIYHILEKKHFTAMMLLLTHFRKQTFYTYAPHIYAGQGKYVLFGE